MSFLSMKFLKNPSTLHPGLNVIRSNILSYSVFLITISSRISGLMSLMQSGNSASVVVVGLTVVAVVVVDSSGIALLPSV